MIVIVDYGYGNVFSVESALNRLGKKCILSSDPKIIESANIIILPGVGAFKQAITRLIQHKLDVSIIKAFKKGTGIIGICLGYQMLFEESEENGKFKGLGLVKGKVKSLKELNPNYKKVPNIGWRKIIPKKPNYIYESSIDHNYVYFVHSFVPIVKYENLVSSVTNFDGYTIHASVQHNKVIGFQFHPEKSGQVGLNILKKSIEHLGE